MAATIVVVVVDVVAVAIKLRNDHIYCLARQQDAPSLSSNPQMKLKTIAATFAYPAGD